MAKQHWTYDDELISCKFYLKYKDKSYKNLKILVAELNNKFPVGSVRLKLKNYEFLYTGGASGMANASFLSKYIYRLLTLGKKPGIKVARKHSADTANSAIRNILTILSIYKGEITAAELDKTSAFFNYCCPYTGKDISTAIKNRMAGISDPSISIDHIVPQNREYCGLNSYGNLVWADAKANENKGGQKDYKTFLLEDDDIAKTSTPAEIQARIDKIEAFQKHSGYDAESLAKVLSPMLKSYYKEIQVQQVNKAAQIAKAAKL